eukprot:GHVN01082930.1.p1 GENE.GHVN01082930.1~~GHVN01082930.1.p1  ORF type:complete len:482 (+),score=76.90 GHVN01082930.1:340-1785(+)
MNDLSVGATHAIVWGTMVALFAYVILNVFWFGQRLTVKEIIKPTESSLSARGEFGWFGISMSLFATIVGPWVLFSLPEVAVFGGWFGVFGYTFSSMIPLTILAIFGPIVWRNSPHDCLTFTDYALHRFGRPTQLLMIAAGLFNTFIGLTAHFTSIGLTLPLLSPSFPTYGGVIPVALLTTAYVFLGGLRASISTDKIQGVALFVLILTCGTVVATSIGAAKTNKDVRIGFLLASILIVPIFFLLGVIGLLALADDPDSFPQYASVAFFVLLKKLPVGWTVLVAILTVLAVSSSVDSSQNALASFVGRELTIRNHNPLWALIFAAAVSAPAAVLGCYGWSVFELFLIGNLVTGAFMSPLFLGLWSGTTQLGAFSGCIVGLMTIFIVGWSYTRNFVEGLTWITLPWGYDEPSAIVTYFTVPFASLATCMIVSLIDNKVSRRPQTSLTHSSQTNENETVKNTPRLPVNSFETPHPPHSPDSSGE